MGEEISKEIAVDGVDVRELYGAQNVYLEQIRALHPALKIVARGSSLKVLGAKSAAERFERRMQGLIDYYLKYGHISREVVAQAFAASGLAADEAPADQDVIVYGNNGTVVRARTVNQQRLVRLYDADDLLFAVGPAGSGKTYTAIALAVRALREKVVRRVILTRPAVEAGEKLGFLPGDMKEKLDPYLQPLYDALNDMIPPARLQKFMEEGTIQIAPHAHGAQCQVHRHGRRDADRPAAPERQRPYARHRDSARREGDRRRRIRPPRHRAARAGQTHRRGFRPPRRVGGAARSDRS